MIKKILFSLIFLSLVFFLSCSKNGNPTSPSVPETPKTNSPIVNYFTASPVTIDKGQSSTLSWEVTNSTKVELYISGDAKQVAAKGTEVVSPIYTKDYLLRAYRDSIYVDKSCTVTVRAWAEVTMSGLEYMNFASIERFSARGTVKNIGTKTVYKVRIYLRFYKKNAWGGGLYKKYDWEVANFLYENEEFKWRLDWDGKEGWDMCKYVDVNNTKDYKITWE